MLSEGTKYFEFVYTFTKRSKGTSEGTLGLNINLPDAAGKFGDSIRSEWTHSPYRQEPLPFFFFF